MKAMKKTAAVFAAAAVAAAACAREKGMLTLQCGGDWCESGEDVRRTFESETFRGILGDRFDFAIYDDMDEPTPEVAAANKKSGEWLVESRRFPAITCLSAGGKDGRRFFAMIENIPFDATAGELAGEILKADARRAEAEALFVEAEKTQGDDAKAASLLGRGFALLAPQAGYFTAGSLRGGKFAYAAQWKRLVALDKGDRFGWRRRFEDGEGVATVRKATDFRLKNDFKGGDAYIASLRKIPQENLLPVQRQSIDMAEYALYRKTAERKAANKALLLKVLGEGRDTVWGQSALGYLVLSGEKIPLAPRKRAVVRPRPEKPACEIPAFPLAAVAARVAAIAPDATLTEEQKKDVALAAVLRRIGEEGWKALWARPGADAFAKAFFADRAWMEDFVWSGPCDGAKALLALESLVYQDGGRWIGKGDCTGRRFATATALQCSSRDEAWLADIIDAYRGVAREKRLHKVALTQSVRCWRYAIQQTQPPAFSHMLGNVLGPDIPDQERYVDKYANMPRRKYDGACNLIPYRDHNCFGDSVQTAIYYESWLASGEFPLRMWSPVVGGVCGELSRFGAACANAHGIPATTCGQPYHCAYLLRHRNGSWSIGNNVSGPTGNHMGMFGGGYTYLVAEEGTFEGDREKRLEADRWCEIAQGRSNPLGLLKRACAAWPTHYGARRAAADAAAKAPLAEHRAFALDCAKALEGWHEPLWALLTPYFSRVAKESGAAALCDELVAFAPLLKHSPDKNMEGDFKAALASWTAPLAGDAALMEKTAHAMLEAQYGSEAFFAQTLGWCGVFLTSDPGRLDRFTAFLSSLGGGAKGGEAKKQAIELAPLVLAAAKADNIDAWRRLNALQASIAPESFDKNKKPRPDKAFGATLLSGEGMLRTSSTCKWDNPMRHIHAIDATPVDGNLFHTDYETEPWAEVVLAGPSRVKGIVVENRHPNKGLRGRAAPFEIQISEDGKEWQTVLEDGETRDEYRVDLQKNTALTRRVRVRRKPGVRIDPLHFTKILVYGDRLY